MAEKIYINLLLLCGILSQGIFGNFMAHEDIKEQSDILNRQKRVINRIPGEDLKVGNDAAPFIVRVKENLRLKCVGSIMSHHVVITIAECVFYESSRYQVFSGASHVTYGTRHNVTSIRKHFGDHPRRSDDGVALLTVDPPFIKRFTGSIQLHSGPLLSGTLGTIYGWGFIAYGAERGTDHQKNLRLIEVPILSHQDCVNMCRPFNIAISDKDICTFHPQKQCGHTDAGAPLVVDGFIAGIRIWTGVGVGRINCEFPDVFVVLQHSVYNGWITSNIRNIEANF